MLLRGATRVHGDSLRTTPTDEKKEEAVTRAPNGEMPSTDAISPRRMMLSLASERVRRPSADFQFKFANTIRMTGR